MKKSVLFLTLLLLSASLTGCGKTDDSLQQYKSDMTGFTNEVNELVASIEDIDLESATRTEELLSYLDEMDEAFAQMSGWDVPKQFSNIEELADEASANLSESVSLYHQAFEDGEDLDENVLDAALEYYSRAFKRLDYIGTILQGELPEDENITIIHESEDDSLSEPDDPDAEEEYEDSVG